MVVISEKFTTGQITFIVRVAIQILSYGGLFLIGLIIFGSAPRVAPLETHDLLNRVAGMSSATLSALTWIARRVFRKSRDPSSPSSLALALALSISYGLFVSLSDIGLIGLHTCTTAGSSFQDFPASIKTDSDALAIVTANMLNGTDPHTVKSYRCDAAHDVVFSINVTERVCTAWHNSTYGDPSDFRVLNSTDSDALMVKNLAPDHSEPGFANLNVYLIGTSGQPVRNGTIQGGLAVVPHATGVRMIVGVPQLSKQQMVDIPKALALEIDIGCMLLGSNGENELTADFPSSKDFFVPDSIYLPKRMTSYTGPDILRDPLAKAADRVRDYILPNYNTSDVDPNGYYRSYNDSQGQFTWQGVVSAWNPDVYVGNSSDTVWFILGNCTEQVHQMLNVSLPSPSLNPIPSACGFYQLSGSLLQDQSAFQAHSEMVCASTTQVNMVSATVALDGDGVLNLNLTHLPSNLNIIEASYFDIAEDKPNVGDSTFLDWDPITRFTLSDNPAGPLQHYIYQEYSPSSAFFSTGTGSAGPIITQVGAAILDVSSTNNFQSLALIDPNYFSTTDWSVAQVTRWAGSVGASFLLASIGYNGWAARGSQTFTVVSTGGRAATCYTIRYAAGFLPLVLAVFVVICWVVVILCTSGIRKAKRLGDLYGGLSPTIEQPFPGKLPRYTFLTWDDDPEPHLKPAVEKLPVTLDAEADVMIALTTMESNEIEQEPEGGLLM